MGIFEIISAIILIIACVFIVVVVLMKDTKTQMSQTISGSTADSYYGKNSGRTKDAMLNKATVVAAVIFFVLALAVNIINVYFGASKTEDESSVDSSASDVSDITAPEEDEMVVVVPTAEAPAVSDASEPDSDNSVPASGAAAESDAPVVSTTAAEDFGMERLEELDPLDTAKYPWNDIGAGHIFADFYQDRLRFVPERKVWFYYENGIWKPDTGSLRAMKDCMELANLIYAFALKIHDEDKRTVYMKYASRWHSHNNRVNILKDAQVYHPIPYGSFDADIYIFNCKNGTLHIDTGEFTEHRSTDLLTKISPVVYDPTAYSERFSTYIDEIMSGDADRARFLQKILGYGLTGDTRHECMTILYGVTTRNGKGTLCESVLKVLGDYGCASRPETIAMKSYTNGSQPSEDVARLAGVRFVNIPEPGKGMVLDAAKVKAMTGNDTLNARFLHENSFDFQPQFKIYVNTNFLPVINDMTLFSSDRIIIIPFDRHFDEQSRDTTLKRQFAESHVQSAILNWLLEGYRHLRSEGLDLPKSVKEATERYQHDSDKMILFFEDNLVADDTAEELTSTVYARYKGWCQENGCYPEGMKNFKQGLQAFAQVVRKRPKQGGEKTTVLLGYRLISEFDAPLLA